MSTNHPNQTQLGFISQGFFAAVKHARVTGLWFMEVIGMRGCSEYIRDYLSAVLPGHRQSIIDITHCHTYEDIYICKDEFGSESVWRR
jgi:hypothetical protein